MVEPATPGKPLDKATSTSHPHRRLSGPLQTSKAALLPRGTRRRCACGRRWVKGSGRPLPSYIYLATPSLLISSNSHLQALEFQQQRTLIKRCIPDSLGTVDSRGEQTRAFSSAPGPLFRPSSRARALTWPRPRGACLRNGPPRDARVTLATRGSPKRHASPSKHR